MRWFRRALILVVCALTPTCTASPDSTWINPQTEPPSEKPGSGGAVVQPGTGGHFAEGGATGSGGAVGFGGKGGAAGASASGGFPGIPDAGAPDATVPPPSDGGATDSGDAGGDASPEDGGAIDAGTGR